MSNKEILFELQEKYLKERSKESLELFFLEIEEASKRILSELLGQKGLIIPYERKKDIIQETLIRLLERYSRSSYKVETSFYQVISYCQIDILFGKKARKESKMVSLSHDVIIDMKSEIEYKESENVMETVVEKVLDEECPDPETRSIVESIIDLGKPWERYLYKVTPKKKREEVQRFMLKMKKRVYEEGVGNAPKHMQLPGM